MLVIRIELVKPAVPNRNYIVSKPTTGVDPVFGKSVPSGFAFWAYDSRGRWRRTPKKI